MNPSNQQSYQLSSLSSGGDGFIFPPHSDDEDSTTQVSDSTPFIDRSYQNGGSSECEERGEGRSDQPEGVATPGSPSSVRDTALRVDMAQRLRYSGMASHDYEPEESSVWREHQAQVNLRDRRLFWTSGKRRAAKRWVLTFVIGVTTGLLAIFITFCTKTLLTLKFSVVQSVMIYEASGEATAGLSFLFFVFFNTFYVLVANAMVYLEPLSAGSGIPEIKCFLNGIALPRIVRAKTLLCKAVGVLFAVSGGLPVGKEGPMVHSGSVIAAGISQGKSNTLGCDTSFSKFHDFRNDREKRDFVACGAAAGVAAAFGAPIGGVLFSLEEGASFWSTKLTWRCFFCAMMTVYTLYVVRTTETWWNQPDETSMFSFGEFYSLTADKINYSVWELFIFIVLGSMGGFIGALFNFLNERLSLWRKKALVHPRSRTIEALTISLAMSCVAYGAPLFWNKCIIRPIESPKDAWSNQERELVEQLVSFQCKPNEYNEVASLFFTDSDTAIKQLFHFREIGENDQHTFSAGALFLFWSLYTAMACITYGLAVPSGLFVPSLLSGAAMGRFCGHVLHKLDGSSGTFADSGTYALVGAAAGLGGMARMTISLAVILLEATGDMQYVLPLMLALMAARFVGNMFNAGLYDIHIKLKRIPFLEGDLPISALDAELTAGHVMSSGCVTMQPMMRVGALQSILSSCDHECFPVVDPQRGDILVGTILRRTICVLLKHQAWFPEDAMHCDDDLDMTKANLAKKQPSAWAWRSQKQGKSSAFPVGWDEIGQLYPRFPEIWQVRITPQERELVVDLRPYINSGAYVVHHTASVNRAYRLFRTMGLRHLPVTDLHNRVVGMITRKDMTNEQLSERVTELDTQSRQHKKYRATTTTTCTSRRPHSARDGGGGGGNTDPNAL